MNNFKPHTHQRGLTIISVVILLALVGFIALMAIKIIPIYIDYFSIKGAIENVKKEPSIAQMSRLSIQDAIQRRFDIGYVSIIQGKDLKIRSQGSKRIVELNYEDRRQLLVNIDIVAKFNDTIELN